MKLSIIIPAYNMEEYLARCLDSVIRPELSGYELIVVNDGSTDGTEALARGYVSRYPELIRLISIPNSGLGQARNAGLETARGEFVFFLDSDDYLTGTAVSEMLEMTERDIDICICDMQAVSPSGRLMEKLTGCARPGAVSLASYPELLLAYPSGCNKLCRRSLFLDTGIRFPGRAWYEDLRTMPKLYLHTDKIMAPGRLWYMYLSRPGSIIKSGDITRRLEIIDAVDDLTGYYREKGRFEQYKEELEFLALKNLLLSISVQVCEAAPDSPVLDTLRSELLRRYPDCASNPYLRRTPMRHRLIIRLLLSGHRHEVRLLMRLNDRVKGKSEVSA